MSKLFDKKYQIVVNVLLVVLIILVIGCQFMCHNKENMEDKKDKNNTKEKNKDKKEKNKKENNTKENKEKFLDWSMYNPPIDNGYIPDWFLNLRRKNMLKSKYNPLGYSNRSSAFYNQGWYPNMDMPPQVIGCGGRRLPCLGGTQEAIPVVNPPIDISSNNIAPVNVFATMDPDPVGVLRQVGVLHKVFGSVNDILPLYGVKRYRNSDTWDYSTKVGREGNFVHVRVLTKRRNNNELQTNDVVQIEGSGDKFRTVVYDNNYPIYQPHYKF